MRRFRETKGGRRLPRVLLTCMSFVLPACATWRSRHPISTRLTGNTAGSGKGHAARAARGELERCRYPRHSGVPRKLNRGARRISPRPRFFRQAPSSQRNSGRRLLTRILFCYGVTAFGNLVDSPWLHGLKTVAVAVVAWLIEEWRGGCVRIGNAPPLPWVQQWCPHNIPGLQVKSVDRRLYTDRWGLMRGRLQPRHTKRLSYICRGPSPDFSHRLEI